MCQDHLLPQHNEQKILHQFTKQCHYLCGVQDKVQNITHSFILAVFVVSFMLLHTFAVNTGKRRFDVEPQTQPFAGVLF